MQLSLLLFYCIQYLIKIVSKKRACAWRHPKVSSDGCDVGIGV